jgi:hypothetical protein
MFPAIAAAPLAVKAAIVTATIGACACVALKSRPSTLIRVAEDASIKVGKVVGSAPLAVVRGTKRLAHETTLEYRARQIDKLQQAVTRQAAELRDMEPEARAKLAADEAAIFRRAEELRAKREAKQGKAPRASRAGRSATA